MKKKTELYSINRIEGDYMILEKLSDGSELMILTSEVSEKLSESDIVRITTSENGTLINLHKDGAETERRKKNADKTLSSLFDN